MIPGFDEKAIKVSRKGDSSSSLRAMQTTAPFKVILPDYESGGQGGTINLEVGDWLVHDGVGYFAIKNEDRKSKKPIFWSMFDQIV